MKKLDRHAASEIPLGPRRQCAKPLGGREQQPRDEPPGKLIDRQLLLRVEDPEVVSGPGELDASDLLGGPADGVHPRLQEEALDPIGVPVGESIDPVGKVRGVVPAAGEGVQLLQVDQTDVR